MIKAYEALKAENERLSLANEAQNETIQRLLTAFTLKTLLPTNVKNSILTR